MARSSGHGFEALPGDEDRFVLGEIRTRNQLYGHARRPHVGEAAAGDAFNGGFAVALAEGMDIVAAAEFGCAVAGISVTRPGTAPSMPRRGEVDELNRSRSAT